MRGLDLEFTVDTRNSFEEIRPDGLPNVKVPEYMSKGKSYGFHRELQKDEILVTSDTMVLCEDEILGKPKDRSDAQRMLHLLSGREHQVITAVTIRASQEEKTFSVTSNVFFKNLTDNEIDYYIDTYKPFDKAGAYGIQEWIGYIGISRIEGSFYNVMGFPTQRFFDELQSFLLR